MAGVETCSEVADGRANFSRFFGRACDRKHSAHGLRHQIEAATLTIWSRMSKTRDRAVHQRGMPGMHCCKAEAKTFHCTWTEILDQHIRLCDQTPEYLFSGWRADINGDPVLVAIHGDKGR